MKKNTKGFTVIEGLLILLIVTVVGGVGWYVWDKNKASEVATDPPKKSQGKAINKASQDTTFVDGPRQGWKTYTNYKAGFSIEVPASFVSQYGGECQKTATSYRPAEGVVPTSVIQDGDSYYITENYTYQLSDVTKDNTGVSYYADCNKVDTTPAVVRQYKDQNNDNAPQLNVIPIQVIKTRSQSDITGHARSIFGNQNVMVESLADNPSGWKDVKLNSPDDLTFNFSFTLRYYEKQDKLVYIAKGQAGNLAIPSSSNFYDNEVISSFKLID